MNDQTNTNESISKRHLVFTLLLESCWQHFYRYLSKNDVGRIDSALTEKSLRAIYLKQVRKFYLVNYIKSFDDLKWILRRGIDLTVCRLIFENKGKL